LKFFSQTSFHDGNQPKFFGCQIFLSLNWVIENYWSLNWAIELFFICPKKKKKVGQKNLMV
jgi:hypothetical protein